MISSPSPTSSPQKVKSGGGGGGAGGLVTKLLPPISPLAASKQLANNFLSMASLNSHTETSTNGEGEEEEEEFMVGAQGPPLELPSVQLEALADAFQENLSKMGQIQDRQYRSKTIPKCFQGNVAVDVLQQLIQDQSGLNDISRQQALQVGRNIQKEFHFFSHVKNSNNNKVVLQDTPNDLYQFENNLPMQVFTMRRQYPSMWDKVTLLENRIPLGDHWGLIKLHKDSFLAKQAVDVLMELKLVQSREEAVHLMCKMNKKVHCCRLADHPGNDGTNFKDDNSLYRFVPKEERIQPQQANQPRLRSRSPKGSASSPNMRLGRQKSTATTTTSTDGQPQQGRGHHRPMRRTKTTDGNNRNHNHKRNTAGTSSRGRSLSPAKDAAYFQDRVTGLRNKLDQHRQERAAAQAANQAAATANGTS